MAYSYRSTSLLPGSDTYNEVQAEIKRQEQEARKQEKLERVKKLNDDSKTTRAQLKIIQEQLEQQEQQLQERKAQQEQQLRERKAQQEQQLLEQQARLEQREQQELQQLQRQDPHREHSFFETLGSSFNRCLGKSEDCLNPDAKKQREYEEMISHNKKLSDKFIKQKLKLYNEGVDFYKRRFNDTYADSQSVLIHAQAAAKTAQTIFDSVNQKKDGSKMSIVTAMNELDKANKSVTIAKIKAAKAAADVVDETKIDELAQNYADRLKPPYYHYQDGGNKTRKTKRRHRKKSLRHRNKSLRHHKKSIRHRKKSVKHRNNH
jgi:hypothetical protein